MSTPVTSVFLWPTGPVGLLRGRTARLRLSSVSLCSDLRAPRRFSLRLRTLSAWWISSWPSCLRSVMLWSGLPLVTSVRLSIGGLFVFAVAREFAFPLSVYLGIPVAFGLEYSLGVG